MKFERLVWTWWMTAWLLAASCGSSGSAAGSPDSAASMDATLDAALDSPMPVDATATDSAMDGGRLGPPYPVVLAHGFFGFEDFAGVDFVNYFFGVRAHLAARGEALVFTPAVDPFSDSVTRGAALEAAVERILASTGHAKVNLIGHSQGGLDARVVAHDRPELVASVTTIATPHEGTKVADVTLGLVANDRAAAIVDRIVRLVGAPVFDALGAETSVVASLRQLSTAGAAALNAAYPDAPGVDYFSIAGRTDRHFGGADCRVADAPSFITRYAGVLDPVDPLFVITEELLDGGLLAPHANDGLVRALDAHRGRFLGCVPADHMDEVGQLLGDSPGFGNSFEYLRFYADLVAWLRAQGY